MSETQKPLSIDDLSRVLPRISVQAGARICDIRNAGVLVEQKIDHSPVTRADREAEKLILDALSENFPTVPIVAEEQMSAGAAVVEANRFFLVDALDGTREFIAGNNDFTVNIALIEAGIPVAGVVYAPLHNVLYCAFDGKAWRQTLSPTHHPEIASPNENRFLQTQTGFPLRLVASRSHRTRSTDAFIELYPEAEMVEVGSSLKFCLLAAGEADIYPRFGPTMEWDTAAGDAILRAAGGIVVTDENTVLQYGKTNPPGKRPYENGNFICFASEELRHSAADHLAK